ncbi:MAG: hypothetical protein ACI3YI_00740 [Bacteroidaceae bacterium]
MKHKTFRIVIRPRWQQRLRHFIERNNGRTLCLSLYDADCRHAIYHFNITPPQMLHIAKAKGSHG